MFTLNCIIAFACLFFFAFFDSFGNLFLGQQDKQEGEGGGRRKLKTLYYLCNFHNLHVARHKIKTKPRKFSFVMPIV